MKKTLKAMTSFVAVLAVVFTLFVLPVSADVSPAYEFSGAVYKLASLTNNIGSVTVSGAITKVKEMTHISIFKKNLLPNPNPNQWVKVCTSTGTEVTTGFIGTGMVVYNMVGDVPIRNYTVFIPGDVNGDGYTDTLDSNLMYLSEINSSSASLTGIYKEAGKVNYYIKNGPYASNITSIDTMDMKYIVIEHERTGFLTSPSYYINAYDNSYNRLLKVMSNIPAGTSVAAFKNNLSFSTNRASSSNFKIGVYIGWDTEVTSGVITNDMNVKVWYGNEMLEFYYIKVN